MFPHRKKQPPKTSYRLLLAAAGTALLLSLLIPGTSPAQQGADPPELRLDPIVVTATRTPRRLSTVGDSIESFSKETIELIIPGDLNDVFRTATGIIVEQSGSRGASTSFRIRGSEDNFVSVMIDGFKISAPDGGRFDFENLSPEWIGGVEILRGPQSPLYGSDAAAGAVNLLLDVGKHGEPYRFETGARYGSFTTWEEFFKVRGGGEKTGFLATLSRIDTNGRFENDGYYRTVGTIAFDYFPTDRAKIRFLYQANQSRFDATSDN
ncbi:MAG: TonB-dependent receptor plug domain-containing protein, partial [bacterium]|nr:TonB-dependent receptor plug domain-containing protein [bacterium]